MNPLTKAQERKKLMLEWAGATLRADTDVSDFGSPDDMDERDRRARIFNELAAELFQRAARIGTPRGWK